MDGTDWNHQDRRRQEAFRVRGEIQALCASGRLDSELQLVDIGRIVSGVLIFTGAVYMFFAGWGVYVPAGEVSMELVTFGSLLAVWAIFETRRIGSEVSALLNGFHMAIPRTADIPRRFTSLDIWPWRILEVAIPFSLATEEFIRTYHQLEAVRWGLLFLSLALMWICGKRLFSLIVGFQKNTSSEISRSLRRCVEELDRALYGGTP